MPMLAYSSDTTDLVARLRRVLTGIDLDCSCRATLDGALERFTSLEYRRQMRRAIAEAREQRDQIVARLAFLAEIDEITEQEADRSVFAEVGLLFDEIGVAAAEAARVIRAATAMAATRR
jgi:hypothetical protein